MARCIVIATPHQRNDPLEAFVRSRIAGTEIIRVRSEVELLSTMTRVPAPDLVFFPHWSWRIPAEVFHRAECILFHMTDVPYGRGGSPLQNLILRGHEETVVAALGVIGQLDAGPVYLKQPLSLLGTAEEILRRASAVVAEMIVEIAVSRPTPRAQEGTVVQFRRRRREDGNLSHAASLSQVYDFIRMLDADGYPRAFVETTHYRLEFSHAVRCEDAVEARVRIVPLDRGPSGHSDAATQSTLDRRPDRHTADPD